MEETKKRVPRQMTGAELKSMLKSSINLKSLGGLRSESLKLEPEDLEWFLDDKVGLFFHWGLYSILGHGEWAFFNEKIPKDKYADLAKVFDPKDFSMDQLVDVAKDLGARYMVMVTRHHDGFALWDSPASYDDFTSVNSACKRDFVSEYVEAARRAKMKVGVYYSPMDWRFPGYFDPLGKKESALKMKKQCYGQVQELCSKYGPIDILWYDGGWLAHKGSDTSSAWFWEPIKLNEMVRRYNPKTLINPRSGYVGDFYCDEGSHDISGGILPVPWEKNMCIASGCSWGWMEDDPVSDLDWLLRRMVNVFCRGGNFLLNVAPDKNGKLSSRVHERVKEIGQWLKKNQEAIYKTRGGPFEPEDGIYGTTYRDNHIYIHVLDKNRMNGHIIPWEGIQKNTKIRDRIKIRSLQELDKKPCGFEILEQGLKIYLSEATMLNPNLEKIPFVLDLLLEESLPKPEFQDIYFTGKN